MTACTAPGCAGQILDDGYCDTCGAKAGARPVAPTAPPEPAPAAPSVAPAAAGARTSESSLTGRSLVTGSARSGGSRRTSTARTSASSRRSSIGAGLLDVPPAPAVDPSSVIMAVPEVAEEKRFCAGCGAPVGRSKGSSPGRQQGFCGRCRTAYDFVPKLRAGDLVGGQYQVVGALAHGGLGWIYLAQDRAVSDRWVVLKGLLNSGDEAAVAAAVVEQRFLAQVEHPNIVKIYNFVTHQRAGYIVMEYVGGPSLKQVLKQRREANGDEADPLPVDQAIAFVLAVLPAFSNLHGRGLVYCDFKPDNMIQTGDQMKLIDLGGVRRVDDPAGDIYGTVGFQAPEVPDLGPSFASDIYTIGRTLAVLTLDFRGYQSSFQHQLPDPADHPVLVQQGSFYRLLLKATAPHPDDRFQSVPELADQLLGVLREVVAVSTGRPQPAASTVFAGTTAEDSLPPLSIDPSDPAAGVLSGLPPNPSEALATLDEAVAGGSVEATVEVRLRRARMLLDLGQPEPAAAELAAIEAADPWEWRAAWLRGEAALAADDVVAAATFFERCRTEVPGELPPKLAAAMVAERAGDHHAAAVLYDVVTTVDPSYVGAVRGLARSHLAAGDVPLALAAYSRVPRTHRAYPAAQEAAARTLIGAGRFEDAAALIETVDVPPRQRAALDVELFRAAVTAVGTSPAAPGTKLRGRSFDERSLRAGLESAYRWLADLTPDPEERVRLVDSANRARAVSLL